MSQSRLSEQLLRVAKSRLLEQQNRNEANLRRANSDLYYAMFHAICEALVEPLGAKPESDAFKATYVTLYRQLSHSLAVKRFNAVQSKDDFSDPVKSFGRHFVQMREKRELADYHPLWRHKISTVRNNAQQTEQALSQLQSVDQVERCRFAMHLSLTQVPKG